MMKEKAKDTRKQRKEELKQAWREYANDRAVAKKKYEAEVVKINKKYGVK